MALLPRFFCLLAALHLLPSCSSAPATVTPREWPFEKGALRLRLSGDPQLNLFHRTPHALVSCLYQLRDPNAFNQATVEPDGLARLLECGRFDPSVTSARRFVLQPRQQLSEVLDRAEGARYLGYVAGYYRSSPEQSVRLVAIPVVQRSGGLLRLEKSAQAGVAELHLRLGPDGIVSGGEK